VDVKFIRSIGEAIREKSILFPESEMLARILITTIARIVKFRYINMQNLTILLFFSLYEFHINNLLVHCINYRGTSDLQADLLSKVLTNIYPYSLEWSPAVSNFFPEPVKQILKSQQAGNAFPLAVSNND